MKVVKLNAPISGRVKINLEYVFSAAEKNLDPDQNVVIVGTDRDGCAYVASTISSAKETIADLEIAKQVLLDIVLDR